MCNLYSITTNQAAIAGLFRRLNRYVGNLAPMPGVFPDHPAPVIRNASDAEEMMLMRWGMPPPPRTGGPPVTNIRNTTSPHWRGWLTAATCERDPRTIRFGGDVCNVVSVDVIGLPVGAGQFLPRHKVRSGSI
jgi:hypothetical protein